MSGENLVYGKCIASITPRKEYERLYKPESAAKDVVSPLLPDPKSHL
jgi:hypothetical protein